MEGPLAPIKDRVKIMEAEFREAVTNQSGKLHELQETRLGAPLTMCTIYVMNEGSKQFDARPLNILGSN
jgi:hypothetical protein